MLHPLILKQLSQVWYMENKQKHTKKLPSPQVIQHVPKSKKPLTTSQSMDIVFATK